MMNLSGKTGTVGVTSRVVGELAGTGSLYPPREERLRHDRESFSEVRMSSLIWAVLPSASASSRSASACTRLAAAILCCAAANSNLALRNSGLENELPEDLWPVEEGAGECDR